MIKLTTDKFGTLFFCALVTVFISLAAGTVSAEKAEVIDRIVAVVNDDVVTLTDLNEELAPYEEKMRQMNYPLEKEMQMRFKLREDVINQLVEKKLTDQLVVRKDIHIGEEEVDRAIERVKSLNQFTDESLRSQLKQQGMAYEAYRAEIRHQLLRNRLVSYEVKSKIVITDEDIQAYYNENKKDLGEKPLEELRTSIADQLYQDAVGKKFAQWLSDLKKDAHIRVIQ
ncbi:SurA N-terminal domain-containing protein [Desulfoluna sp.]|uniref:SurA N-terminal domain-containing protein n=1 Tax=Desulfoluna sp. TaxID=2045199 RepID=UPI00261EBAD0|nr:SurA N-terminal domain-containing protein [Desulfoluna sp.]